MLSYLWLIFMPLSLFSQIRIDKQQNFGGYGHDQSVGIIVEKDYILIAGNSDTTSNGTGQVPSSCIDIPAYQHAWIVKVNYDYEIIDSWCYNMYVKDFLKVENIDRNEYYLVGAAGCKACDNTKRNLSVIRINDEGEVIWSSCFGNDDGYYYTPFGGDLTGDGGCLASGPYYSANCDISNVYGSIDVWIVAMDSLGNMAWETTLGTDGIDVLGHVDKSTHGGFHATMQNDPVSDYGSLLPNPKMNMNATWVKLDDFGNVEWQECYGCNQVPGQSQEATLYKVLDLEDGYLGVGGTTCNTGDLQGSGWHPGWGSGGTPTFDIWLFRLDNDRNIVWSKCYGGSGLDGGNRIFQTSDGGFIMFGGTHSINGDVASAAHLNLGNPNSGVAWVFRIDANGDLLWERCLGEEQGGRTVFMDAFQHNDREYTVVGDLLCPLNGISGDVNCPNCSITTDPNNPGGTFDYWILHITDTVDYSTVSIPERPVPEETSIEIYPNPTNNTVCVVLPAEAEATKMELVNMSGQVVASKTFNGKSSWLEMGNLPQGMYILRVHNTEICLTRKVLRN